MRNSFDSIRALIEEASRRALSAGVPVSVVTPELMRAEAAFIVALSKQRRHFVAQVAEVGTMAMAERRGVTDRAIRKRRTGALREIGTYRAASVPV